MNILLVYPKYPDTFWSFKHVLKFIRKKAAFPPLGLLTVAAMLPGDWQKKLVDLNVTALTDDDIRWADLVMISAMIVQKDSADEIINHCHQLNKKVAAGGPLFTAQPEKYTMVDYLVLGEAEATMPSFVNDLSDGRLQKVYQSSSWPSLSQTPLPLWSLLDLRHYATLLVQFSRGCPFDCEFCDIVYLNGHYPRTKSPAQMIAEFEALYNLGWRGTVFIVDDNFVGNKIAVKKFLRSAIDWQKQHRYPFKFLTEASINLAADEELMNLMSVANFADVFLGLETPCLESLKECGKNLNVKTDLVAAVKKIQRHGMQVMGGYIVGFDSDTKSIFTEQLKFIQETGVVVAMVGMLTALPATRLWHRLRDENRLLSDSTGGNTDGTLNFIPKMNREVLAAGYKQLIVNLYSNRNYYRRIKTLIKNYRPTSRLRLSWTNLNAFFMSIWIIGVRSRQRFYYWRLIIKTFFTKIKAFPMAITLAIYGLHFQKVAQAVGKKDN